MVPGWRKDGERIAAIRRARGYFYPSRIFGAVLLFLLRPCRDIAKADGYGSLGLSRREAAWAMKALRDEPLPLFAAATTVTPFCGPKPMSRRWKPTPMTAGREVVEDDRSQGLSLRAHPVAFLRTVLTERGFLPCERLGNDCKWPAHFVDRTCVGSTDARFAKGVMFITLEDETAVANRIGWPSVFDANRCVVLGCSPVGMPWRVQREGEVVHLIVEHLLDLTSDLKRISGLDVPFPLVPGRGDEARQSGFPASRDGTSCGPGPGTCTFSICTSTH